jgi:hypothetical protein
MRLFRQSLLVTSLATGLIAASSCGKKSSDDSSDSDAADSAAALVLELTNKITLADIASYGGGTALVAKSNQSGAESVLANEMTSSYWTTAANIANMYCGGDMSCGGEGQQSSPKEFFDDQLNKDFKTLPGGENSEGAPIGVMGRMTQSMMLQCTILYHIGSSGGLPAAQTKTVAMTNALLAESNTFCGASLQLPQEPLDVTMTVSEVTGQFSRHINVKSAAFENDVYLFDDGNSKRVFMNEKYTNTDGGGNYPQYSRWYLQYDGSSKTSKFEGFERGFITSATQSSNGGALSYYRMTVDESSKDVGVWGFYGTSKYISGTLKLNMGTMFAGRGNTEASNASIGFAELDSTAQDGSLRSGHPYVGCIGMDDGTFVSGGACSAYALTAADMESSLTMVKDKIMAKSAATDWKFDESVSQLGFTMSDMLTADPAY